MAIELLADAMRVLELDSNSNSRALQQERDRKKRQAEVEKEQNKRADFYTTFGVYKLRHKQDTAPLLKSVEFTVSVIRSFLLPFHNTNSGLFKFSLLRFMTKLRSAQRILRKVALRRKVQLGKMLQWWELQEEMYRDNTKRKITEHTEQEGAIARGGKRSAAARTLAARRELVDVYASKGVPLQTKKRVLKIVRQQMYAQYIGIWNDWKRKVNKLTKDLANLRERLASVQSKLRTYGDSPYCPAWRNEVHMLTEHINSTLATKLHLSHEPVFQYSPSLLNFLELNHLAHEVTMQHIEDEKKRKEKEQAARPVLDPCEPTTSADKKYGSPGKPKKNITIPITNFQFGEGFANVTQMIGDRRKLSTLKRPIPLAIDTLDKTLPQQASPPGSPDGGSSVDSNLMYDGVNPPPAPTHNPKPTRFGPETVDMEIKATHEGNKEVATAPTKKGGLRRLTCHGNRPADRKTRQYYQQAEQPAETVNLEGKSPLERLILERKAKAKKEQYLTTQRSPTQHLYDDSTANAPLYYVYLNEAQEPPSPPVKDGSDDDLISQTATSVQAKTGTNDVHSKSNITRPQSADMTNRERRERRKFSFSAAVADTHIEYDDPKTNRKYDAGKYDCGPILASPLFTPSAITAATLKKFKNELLSHTKDVYAYSVPDDNVLTVERVDILQRIKHRAERLKKPRHDRNTEKVERGTTTSAVWRPGKGGDTSSENSDDLLYFGQQQQKQYNSSDDDIDDDALLGLLDDAATTTTTTSNSVHMRGGSAHQVASHMTHTQTQQHAHSTFNSTIQSNNNNSNVIQPVDANRADAPPMIVRQDASTDNITQLLTVAITEDTQSSDTYETSECTTTASTLETDRGDVHNISDALSQLATTTVVHSIQHGLRVQQLQQQKQKQQQKQEDTPQHNAHMTANDHIANSKIDNGNNDNNDHPASSAVNISRRMTRLQQATCSSKAKSVARLYARPNERNKMLENTFGPQIHGKETVPSIEDAQAEDVSIDEDMEQHERIRTVINSRYNDDKKRTLQAFRKRRKLDITTGKWRNFPTGGGGGSNEKNEHTYQDTAQQKNVQAVLIAKRRVKQQMAETMSAMQQQMEDENKKKRGKLRRPPTIPPPVKNPTCAQVKPYGPLISAIKFDG